MARGFTEFKDAADAAGCAEGLRKKVLRIDGPFRAQGFLSLTGPLAPRVADCPSGNAYKVSVTGFTFSVIWHENNSADWLAALAPLWWLRHHLSPASGGTTTRAKLRVTYEKIASRSFVLPPLAGEVPRSGQGGMPFRRPPGRLYGFRRQRRHKNGAEGAVPRQRSDTI